jgi:uncharacterized protein (TIRG00374 family)
MTRKVRTLLRTLLSFLLTALFLYLAFRNANLAELWTSLAGANLWWILALVPLGLFSHWVRAWRWKYLLAPLKPHASMRNLFSAVMIGYMVNNVLPRAGELVRAYMYGRLEKISRSATLGTIVVERILDTITFLFMLCTVLFLYPNSLDPFVENVQAVRGYFLLGSVVLLILSAVLLLKSEALFGLVKFLKPIIPKRYAGRMDGILDAFLEGIGAGAGRQNLFAVSALSLFLFAVYGLTMYVGFYSLDAIAARGFDFGVAFVLLTITTVAYVLPAPGAMGTYHSFLTYTLAVLYGVDSVSALSFSIITHEVSYLTITVVGLGYFFKDHVHISEITEQAVGEEQSLNHAASRSGT